MYKLNKIFLMFLIVAGVSSCDLLQNQEPQQSLSVEGGLETIEDFESALIGAYDNVQEFPGADGVDGDSFAQVLFANDIIADDAHWTGSFPTYVEIASQQMTANNSSIEGHWDGAYEAINSVNIILNGLEGLDAPQAEIDNIRGQALFIRALEYYYLAQYFAAPWGATADNSHPGVPIQLEPVTSQEDFAEPSRASVSAVYDQIVADLEQAQGLITNTTPNRATADAATALLARIALIQSRWADAADLAGQVIPNYTLSSDVTEYFISELSGESIFEVQNTVQDVPDPANTSITAVYNANTRDDIQISDAYVEALDEIINADQEAALAAANQTAIDMRDSLLLTGTNSPSDVTQDTDADNSTKYEDEVNAADNLPILRLSEMILTRAEALVEEAPTLSAVPQEALDLLNTIRTRAITVYDEEGNPVDDKSVIEYDIADFATKDELIDAILLERRVELAFEGHRKTDLQRKQLSVRGTPWDADILVFPIPQSQIDANENIEQNPGYEEN